MVARLNLVIGSVQRMTAPDADGERPTQRAQERRLPRAVRADNRDALRHANLQVDLAQDLHAVDVDVHVTGTE